MKKINPQFISGFYSGVLNGSMFIINAIRNIIYSEHPETWTEKDAVKAIADKLEVIKALEQDNENE